MNKSTFSVLQYMKESVEYDPNQLLEHLLRNIPSVETPDAMHRAVLDLLSNTSMRQACVAIVRRAYIDCYYGILTCVEQRTQLEPSGEPLSLYIGNKKVLDVEPLWQLYIDELGDLGKELP